MTSAGFRCFVKIALLFLGWPGKRSFESRKREKKKGNGGPPTIAERCTLYTMPWGAGLPLAYCVVPADWGLGAGYWPGCQVGRFSVRKPGPPDGNVSQFQHKMAGWSQERASEPHRETEAAKPERESGARPSSRDQPQSKCT